MKVKRLIIKNIGMVADETIELNKPLMLFYGDIKQGKTTLLNAVKWVFGGSYPMDIIRHGEKEASVKMLFDNGSITREWYFGKDGKVTDRPIVLVLDGEPVKRPVDRIKEFLNPFLLDNEYVKKMTEKERQTYFVELFGVDTKDLDSQIARAMDDAKTLRATIKGYGEIDTTEVIKVDVQALKGKKASIVLAHDEGLESTRVELARIRKEHLAEVARIKEKNRLVREINKEVEEAELVKTNTVKDIADLEQRLKDAKKTLSEKEAFLVEHKRQDEMPEPPPPDTLTLEAKLSEPADTTAIEEEITQGTATNVRYEQYQKNLTRQKQKAADEKKVLDLEATQRDLKKQKAAKLKVVSETCGIPGLIFDESGNFEYDGTQAGMLSTSQIMKLSSELSALYPAGFGLELIDRAESLGKSIFGFIERAQKEEKSILATIVGEKPAVVPENVGVWVVEDGKVKA